MRQGSSLLDGIQADLLQGRHVVPNDPVGFLPSLKAKLLGSIRDHRDSHAEVSLVTGVGQRVGSLDAYPGLQGQAHGVILMSSKLGGVEAPHLEGTGISRARSQVGHELVKIDVVRHGNTPSCKRSNKLQKPE